MGFGHRVYKNYDPRAKIMQRTTREVLAEIGHKDDPLFESPSNSSASRSAIPISSKGSSIRTSISIPAITLKAMGFPTSMFYRPVRPGAHHCWISQWRK